LAFFDGGYKGPKTVLWVEIMMHGTSKVKTSFEKLRNIVRFRRRAAIEPVIGYLKNGYGMV
jgi:Holliday junction resolvase